jgi:superfamily II DNA or RNA helicase
MALPASVTAARSWPDFVAALDALADTTAKGDAFEHLVAHYLRTDPKYRTKLARVWPEAELPADLRARLHLPNRDKGIDLIAETHTGEFWAIQAKYRADTSGSLTFDDLATFSSRTFHLCAGAFTYALVCTTTARISGDFKHVSNIGALTTETWAALPAAFFESLAAPASTPPPPLVPRPPRPHQTQAIERAVAYFAEPGQTRGKLIHPCGAGKSLTAYWVARDLDARRVLVAVPSLALVRQTLETWMTEALADGRAADWLCVCSDDEIASDFDNEELVARIHELGLPCDTDPAELEKHLRAAAARPGLLVVLTTYQSSPVLAQAARAAGTSFDLCVCDEAHKTTGVSSSYFAHLLHDENLPLPRRLFMTATERRFASSRSDDIVSMDDPELYGETIDLLTFKAAIAAEPPILCDYRLLTIGVRESEVRALVEENRWLDLGPDGLDEVTSLALASLVALRRATAQYGVRHTVSFHSSILRASRFRDLNNRLNEHLPDAAPVRAFHVTGKMGSAARARELERFIETEPSLVTNARCLTEGVDVPGIDCVFFADPKGSTIDIVQASGRALRLDPKSGKKLGYILLPLVVPDGATPEDVAESTGFKFVLLVLRALAAHDERIVDWIKAKQTKEPTDVAGDLIQLGIDEAAIAIGITPEEFSSAILLQCWKALAKLRWRTFEDARKWALESGINKSTDWVKFWRAGKLPPDIPSAPYNVYKGIGWIDWGDFLGFRRPVTRKAILPYDEAREFSSKLGLKNGKEWTLYARKGLPNLPPLPDNIPRNPSHGYRNRGWIDWPTWLGQKSRGPRYVEAESLPFELAREFARNLKLRGQKAWRDYCSGALPQAVALPPGIPRAPEKAYAGKGWAGYPDWLGTDTVATKKLVHRDYAAARDFVHSLNLKTRGQWSTYMASGDRPKDIPTNPKVSYRSSGWVSWTDWLGHEVPEELPAPIQSKRKKWRSFADALAFVHGLNIASSTEWRRYAKGELADFPPKPDDIPASPRYAYPNDWKDWGHWTGTNSTAPFDRGFVTYEEARSFASKLNFKTSIEWTAWASRDSGLLPDNIPVSPQTAYKNKGWVSWPDFLGIK